MNEKKEVVALIDYKNQKFADESAMAKEDLDFMVKRQKLQFESALLNTKESLESSKKAIAVSKMEYPMDIEKVINLQIEVEALEDGVKRLNALMDEFGFSDKVDKVFKALK